MTEPWIEITAHGYLRMSAHTAGTFFPNDVLVAMVRDGQLVLLPTRGPAAGGLLLKQYNPAGDRCVLITEVMATSSEVGPQAGIWPATWDSPHHALLVPLGVNA